MTAKPRIGFIGVGAMGEPMASSLLRAGFPLTASAHRRRDGLERVLAQGGKEAADPRGVAAASDIVITCVPDAPQVDEALFGPAGAAGGAEPGTIFVDMSTISPVASRSFAARLTAQRCGFVDAPVSGGPARASSGTLTIMAGGSVEDFETVRPVLEAMGTPHHVGAVGLGETVKLVNQLIIASVMIANAEALTFARNAGADLEAVRKVLSTATASNYLLEQWLPKTWFAGTFQGGFALDLLRKDLWAALDAGREMKMPMPASSFAYQLYTLRSAEGDGMLDYSAVAKFYEHVAGD
ncbi:MAG TPA: NAD(P)-dependent oxidoreductase [Candidatus Baltobacteraceae bacterium]|nr:NAD(P)-dependent oxidoreductase [Candidatus Baltobacteraceae bacterium]